jgi:hypothetical protein
MGLLDTFNEWFSDSPEWKGKRFEKYVLGLFNEKYYDLEHKTHSFQENKERFVKSSLDPDFILRYRPTKEVFAVEAKYRSGLNPKGMLEWTYPEQLRRYQEFQRNRNIPFFVVIGFGGIDDDPQDMFVLPLEEAKYPTLYPSVFNKFSRNPKKEFYWKNGKLM